MNTEHSEFRVFTIFFRAVTRCPRICADFRQQHFDLREGALMQTLPFCNVIVQLAIGFPLHRNFIKNRTAWARQISCGTASRLSAQRSNTWLDRASATTPKLANSFMHLVIRIVRTAGCRARTARHRLAQVSQPGRCSSRNSEKAFQLAKSARSW